MPLPSPPTLERPVRPTAAARRALVIDPEARSLRLATFTLARAGFEVTATAGAAQAVTALEARPHDLVVCAAHLGDDDGFELCRRLRQRQPGRAPAIVMMLAERPTLPDRLLALQLGIDDCLTKPLSPAELLARAHALLQRSLRERLESPGETRASFTGRLCDLAVPDLLQAMAANQRAGVVHLGSPDWRSGS